MRKAKPARGEMTSPARPFWSSRHIVEPARANVLINFADHSVKSSIGDVALHLLIPLVVLPAMQPRREFGAFFERKLFNRFLNLFDAHDWELMG